MKKTLRFAMVALMGVFGMSTMSAADKWVKADATELQTGDIVVIVDQTSSTAMTNDKGTKSAPSATEVALNADKSELTGTIADKLKWVVTVENGEYQFGVGESYLYCTNTNNGVRVGDNANNTFKWVADDTNANSTEPYLVNSATSRYVGVYNNQDWRCYTSINANIKATVTAFYKYVNDASDNSVATKVTIDATGITNTDLYTGTAAGKLTATVSTDAGDVEGAVVTWTSSKEDVATIAADGTVTLVAKGTTTITAAYAGVENQYQASQATYELTVTTTDPNVPGTINNPYTVAQAREAIDAGAGVEGVYATGIVSEIVTAYSSSFGNISYNISVDGTTTADQLQAYRGKSYDGANFTSDKDIQVGDVVVIYGNLTKYNDTYEFAADNQLVSLKREGGEEPQPQPVEFEGDGTAENPYTIADLLSMDIPSNTSAESGQEKVWVKGVIVGAVNNNKIETTTETASNIALATAEGETEFAKVVPVQLPTGEVRTALNVVDNPTLIGKTVSVYGHILKYFNVTGVKNVTDYNLETTDAIESINTVNAQDGAIYNMAGQRVMNAQKGIFIQNGKKFVVK